MQQLSGSDTALLYMDSPKAPNHILLLYTYDPSTAADGRLDFNTVLSHVAGRLGRSRSFRQKMVRVPLNLDFPYWVEDSNFDLEFHVRRVTLPAPGSWRDLTDEVARIFSRPLDLTRPPWELYFIEGLADGIDGIESGGIALLLKIHHMAVDGVSGVEMITALHDAEVGVDEAEMVDDWSPEPDPSALALIQKAALSSAGKPLRLARVIRDKAPAIPRVIRGVRGGEIERAPGVPLSPFNAPVSARRTLGAHRLPLASVKSARRAVPGSTVNDIILTAVGGALRKYLGAHDALPETPLIAFVPISTRNEEERGSGGNMATMFTTTLATDLADPVERLTAVKAGTERFKKMHEAIGAKTLGDLSDAMPGALIGVGARAQALGMRSRPLANTAVTNVPGPRHPIYFRGARAIGPYLAAQVRDGVGLMHGVTSTSDQIAVTFLADRAMVPDPEFYEDCLRESFQELIDAGE